MEEQQGDVNPQTFEALFNLLDTNHDALVTVSEAKGALEAVRAPPPSLEDAFGALPADASDGGMTLPVFAKCLAPVLTALLLKPEDVFKAVVQHRRRMVSPAEDLVKVLFEAIDVSAQGVLAKDVVMAAMEIIAPQAVEEVAAAVAALDSEGKGLGFTEFAKLLDEVKLGVPIEEAIGLVRSQGQQPPKEPEEDPEVREKRLQRMKEEAEKVAAAEKKARHAIFEDMEASWATLSSTARRAIDEKEIAERLELERERERRRREFQSGGGERQRQEIRAMQIRRQKEEEGRKARKLSESRVRFEDRLEAQKQIMFCCGEQLKVLRQLLTRNTDHIRLESEREFADLSRSVSKHRSEIDTHIDRLENMAVTVGRALMQESMTQHGEAHKSVLSVFPGDKDFSWLGTDDGIASSLSPKDGSSGLRSNKVRLTTTQVNFGDSENLCIPGPTSPRDTLQTTMKALKRPIWAIYRYYQSTPSGLTYNDFLKLTADCKLDIAGSLPVLWVNVLNNRENCEVLGLLPAEEKEPSTPASLKSTMDFNTFAYLLLLLACERYAASSSASVQHKLRCFVLKEVLPMLPHEVGEALTGMQSLDSPLGLAKQASPSIPALLAEYFEILLPVVDCLHRDITAFVSVRKEATSFDPNGLCAPAEFLTSLGLETASPPARQRLPKVKVKRTDLHILKQFQGTQLRHTLTVAGVYDFLAFQCPILGRQTLREAVGRGYVDLLGATYPSLPSVTHTDCASSTEPVPFLFLLAMICRIATNTAIAATVPPPPPVEREMSPSMMQVYSLCKLLTHEGRYVLNL